MKLRIGNGIDFHRLIKGRPFFLGGVLIPCAFGPEAHSDGDVLLHAICDALLGALSLGDIGLHFPNSDPKYKNIDSKILLSETNNLILNNGYKINNIDTTVCLENPKIKPYTIAMQQAIASVLNISVNNISIKATTTEKLGFIGRQEGVMATATCLLITNDTIYGN